MRAGSRKVRPLPASACCALPTSGLFPIASCSHGLAMLRRRLMALPELGSRGKKAYKPAPKDKIEREIEGVIAAGARYLFHDQDHYPCTSGRDRQRAPDHHLQGQSGSRQRALASPWWARAMRRVRRRSWRGIGQDSCPRQALTVVSGLARGIDGAAHEGKLSQDHRRDRERDRHRLSAAAREAAGEASRAKAC